MPPGENPDMYSLSTGGGWGLRGVGVGVGSHFALGTPHLRLYDPGGVSPRNLSPSPHHTLGIAPADKVSLGLMGQPPSLSACTPTPKILQGCNRAESS